uniref:ATP-dependent DNA helicase n=1 Tax=Amphimedon queenslandica TaxID=400682 RepID=A0A1X7UK60_AMPQE
MCAIAPPTGIAVINVGGQTVHRLFQFPIQHEGKRAGYLVSSDLFQLPPVNGRPVFYKISNKLVKTRLGAANAVNIQKETEYDELKSMSEKRRQNIL